MDEKNTCDGRRTDRSCLDYQGVNDFQDTNSVICVHDLGFAIFINLILAAFNMLPFGPLDGKKIFDADRRVWALVGLPAILIALPVYFGI